MHMAIAAAAVASWCETDSRIPRMDYSIQDFFPFLCLSVEEEFVGGEEMMIIAFYWRNEDWDFQIKYSTDIILVAFSPVARKLESHKINGFHYGIYHIGLDKIRLKSLFVHMRFECIIAWCTKSPVANVNIF